MFVWIDILSIEVGLLVRIILVLIVMLCVKLMC